MFCKKKATLLVAILCVFAVSFVACSKKDAVSSGAATGADGATSQEVTKADKKAEEKKAKESKKGSSEVKLPTTPNAEEDFIVELTKDGTGAVVTGYKGKSGGVYIPATIQGLPVKEVEFDVVSDEFVLVNALVISDGCTRVTIKSTSNGSVRENERGQAGWYEVSYSNGGWNYVKIDTNLGTEIQGITLLSLPDSVTYYFGLDRTYITEFEVPAGVKVIDKLPPTLEKISFRGAPEEIGKNAFEKNTKIKTITLPDSIRVIAWGAFYQCTALESINFPSSLENIGWYAFNFCDNLKEIIIPDSLTSLKFSSSEDSFYSCSSLPLATQARLKKLGYTGEF